MQVSNPDNRAFVAGAGGSRVCRALAAALLFAMCAGGTAAHGQCQYEVTAIIEGPQCPFSGPRPLTGSGMNNHGHVVGSYRNCDDISINHAFFWSEETGLFAVPYPDGVNNARAYDINDHGQIVGEHRVSGVGWFGFMYDMNTGEFMQLASKHDWGGSIANAINNSGQVAGARSIGKPGTPNPPMNAVIWDTTTGEVTDLGVMDGPNSEARAIDAKGHVGGLTGQLLNSLGFAANERRVVVLPPLPGGSTSFVNAMNDHDELVGGGTMDDADIQSQPAFWANGAWQGLGLLKGAHAGGARAINNVGQVGGSSTSSKTGQRAFLWQHGIMVDLNDLTDGDHSTLTRVTDINKNGQILVRVGSSKAALLTPINVPKGDLNYDCAVNVHDLIMLIEDLWGPCADLDDCPGDISGPLGWPDGVVDVFDIIELINNWD